MISLPFFERPPLDFPHAEIEHHWQEKSKRHETIAPEDLLLFTKEDYFHLGPFYENLKLSGRLDILISMIKKRKEELSLAKTIYKPIVEEEILRAPLFFAEFDLALNFGFLIRVEEGVNGTYFLKNQIGEIEFVIKPEESALTIHNPKNKGSPFREGQFPIRKFIPLYQTVMTDYLAYKMAELAQLEMITPETHLALMASDEFYDIADNLESSLYEEFIRITGIVDKEKLVSVQRFEKEGICLCTQVQAWLDEGLTDEQIAEKIDQDSFERAFLFCLLTADTDAHCANFLTKEVMGKYIITKIDNSFSFPTRNGEFSNFLVFLANAEKPLLPSTLLLIENLPIQSIVYEMKKIGLPDRVHAFLERTRKIQMLAKRPYITAAGLNKGIQTLQMEYDYPPNK